MRSFSSLNAPHREYDGGIVVFLSQPPSANLKKFVHGAQVVSMFETSIAGACGAATDAAGAGVSDVAAGLLHDARSAAPSANTAVRRTWAISMNRDLG